MVVQYGNEVQQAAHVSPVTKLVTQNTRIFIKIGIFENFAKFHSVVIQCPPNGCWWFPDALGVPQTSLDVYNCVCECLRWVRRSGERLRRYAATVTRTTQISKNLEKSWETVDFMKNP